MLLRSPDSFTKGQMGIGVLTKVIDSVNKLRLNKLRPITI